MAAPPVASKLTMRKFDARKARISRLPKNPEISETVETIEAINPSQQSGLRITCLATSGRTIVDSTEIKRNSGMDAAQRYFAQVALRSCTGPSVLRVR